MPTQIVLGEVCVQKKDSVPVKVTDPDSVQEMAYPDRDSFQGRLGCAILGVETTDTLKQEKVYNCI